jgi:hemerythrin superfamily protein
MTHESTHAYDRGNNAYGSSQGSYGQGSSRSGNGYSSGYNAQTDKRHQQHSGGATSALIAGAAGFGLGLLVLAGRKAAFQAPTYTAGDWFEGLKAEHRAARKLFDALAQSSDEDQKKRGTMLMELQYAISKHNVQEEYVVYCVLAEMGQAEVAEGLNADHFELKQGLFELEMIVKEQRGGFADKLAEVREAFESHVREEEEEAFPTLQASLSEEQKKMLTNRMNREGFKVA